MLKFRINRLLDHYRCQAGATERDSDHVVFDFEFFLRLFNQITCGGAAERQMDLRAWAREVLGLPLATDNDARMALISEWQHGAGRGCDNVAVITLYTRLGASAVIESRVLRGAHGQAGIMGGHLTVRYGGRQCVCGNIGCSETEASTWRLDKLARERDAFAGSPLSREPVLDYAAGSGGRRQATPAPGH